MINRITAFRVNFLAAALTLLATFASGQTYKELGGTGQIANGLMVRNYFHLPQDTVLSDAKNSDVDTCQQIAKKGGDIYSYNCTLHRWVKIVSGVAAAIDSARRSHDTLYFRRTIGGELAVPMDYYTKSESDNRYVLSPSGRITANWLTAWDYCISYEVPNISNPDLKYLIVNGTAGDTVISVTGGTGTGDFTPGFVAVAFDKAGDHYNSFYVVRQSGSDYHLDRPLKHSLSADTVKFLWSSWNGQHMTDYGYRGYADMIYDYHRNLAARDYKLYSFYPEDNDPVPFTAINGAVQGGFIPGTSSPQTLQISTSTISCAQTSVLHYLIQQGGVTDRGVEWTVNLGKKSGYLETWVGVNRILPGFAKVLFYLDDVLVKTDTVRGCVQKLTYSYSNASTGKVQIVTGDNQPAQIKVSRTVWHQTDIDPTTKVYTGGKILFVGDSWTQHWINGGVSMKSSPERFRHRWVADGGDPADIINVGRGGMTSAWGLYFLKGWLDTYKPKYTYFEFYINDANSSGSVGDPGVTTWNFNSTDPYAAGTDVDGKVTQAQWKANLLAGRDTIIAHESIPIMLMNTPTASVTQTQTQSAWFSANYRPSQYYDVEAFFTSTVFADKAVNAPLVTATNINTDTLYNRVLNGGSATISGSYIMKLQQLNSASAKGLIIAPAVNYTGSNGKVLSVQNVPTIGSGEIFSIKNNGSVTATDFTAGMTGFTIPPFTITSNAGIVRFSATNSTTMDYLYLADSFRNTIRARIPLTLQNYSTSALPTPPKADKGSLAYDSLINRPAYYDGFFWNSLARESDMNKRFDSTTAKDRFIQNSTAPQTANLNITGTAIVGALVATTDLVVKSTTSGMAGTSAIRFTEPTTSNRYGIIGKGTGANWDLQVASDNGATVLVSKGVSSLVGDSDRVIVPRRELRMGNGVYNHLIFEPTTTGFGAPTLTNRSWGTKVVYRPDLTAFLADYATGIETNYLWTSVPSNAGTFGFKWYGGTTLAATLSATGNLSLLGNITATAPAYSSGGITGVGRNNTSGRWEAYSPTLTDITNAGNTTSNTISVGGLTTTGAFYPQLSVVSTGTTLTAGYSTVIGNTSSGACTLTLPTGSPAGGRMYFIKRSSQANALTLNVSGTDAFDDGTTTMNVTNAVIVQLQGGTWWVLAKY